MLQRMVRAAGLPALLVLIGWMLRSSRESAQAALQAMETAATAVIPSLFPFAVLSCFLVKSGAVHHMTGAWKRTAACIFGIEEAGVVAWILGSLCGYPIGASVLAELYRSGAIRKQTAERMMGFCNNAGPAFLVSVAGTALLGSFQAGILLLSVHLLSAVLVGLLYRQAEPGPDVPHLAPAEPAVSAFTAAVRQASVTMVQITGFLVLSSVLLSLAAPILPKKQTVFAMISGFLEVTNGLYALSVLPYSCKAKFILSAVLLGWSGCCVHLQVLSQTVPVGLSCRFYLTGKLLQSLISLLLAMPVSAFLSDVRPAAGFSVPLSAGLFCSLMGLLSAALIIFTFLWKFCRRSCIMGETVRKR